MNKKLKKFQQPLMECGGDALSIFPKTCALYLTMAAMTRFDKHDPKHAHQGTSRLTCRLCTDVTTKSMKKRIDQEMLSC